MGLFDFVKKKQYEGLQLEVIELKQRVHRLEKMLENKEELKELPSAERAYTPYSRFIWHSQKEVIELAGQLYDEAISEYVYDVGDWRVKIIPYKRSTEFYVQLSAQREQRTRKTVFCFKYSHGKAGSYSPALKDCCSVYQKSLDEYTAVWNYVEKLVRAKR